MLGLFGLSSCMLSSCRHEALDVEAPQSRDVAAHICPRPSRAQPCLKWKLEVTKPNNLSVHVLGRLESPAYTGYMRPLILHLILHILFALLRES